MSCLYLFLYNNNEFCYKPEVIKKCPEINIFSKEVTSGRTY